MKTYEGRFCYLEELNTANDFELFDLIKNNECEYRKFVYTNHEDLSEEEFKGKLNSWFKNGRYSQIIVRKNSERMVVGTIFFYDFDTKNQDIKLSCFFTPEVRNSLLVSESLGACILFAKEVIGIKTLSFNIYGYNAGMKKIADKIKAVCITQDDSKKSYRLTEEVLDVLIRKMYRLVKP